MIAIFIAAIFCGETVLNFDLRFLTGHEAHGPIAWICGFVFSEFTFPIALVVLLMQCAGIHAPLFHVH